MKKDLAGGTLPSGRLGSNVAWWQMILAFNIRSAKKRPAVGEAWMSRRTKAVRFGVIGVVGRLVEHARWVLNLSGSRGAVLRIIAARARSLAPAQVPGN